MTKRRKCLSGLARKHRNARLRDRRKKIEKENQRRNVQSQQKLILPLLGHWKGKNDRNQSYSQERIHEIRITELNYLNRKGYIEQHGLTRKRLLSLPIEQLDETLHKIHKTYEAVQKMSIIIPYLHKRGKLQKYGIHIEQLMPINLRIVEALNASIFIDAMEDPQTDFHNRVYAAHQLEYLALQTG